MAVITRAYSEVSGQIAYASSVNRVVDDLYTLQAGNINSANIAASGVGASNLETSAVQARAVDTTAIITRHLNSEAVTFDKVAYELLLGKEIFS